MSVSIGTLIVDLQANTASFVSGMDKAGQIALTSSRNIKRAFDAIGTGIITALAGAEATLAAMLDRAIEGAAKLEDLAQSAGISVAALSALDYAAKQSGLSQEQLVKGLEKMSKSMLAASTAAVHSTNAYKTLGVSVTEANGQLRPTQDVLADLAGKFAVMQDGPMKTALALQIFGKSGADLVPLLNRGKEGVTDLMEEAKKLGVVIDDQTAEAAKHFEESMNKLKAAADGVSNKLMKELLPSLQLVVDNITSGAEDSQSRFNDLLKVAGMGAKLFIVAFGGIQTFFDDLGQRIKYWGASVIHIFEGIGSVGKAVWDHNWNELSTAVKNANDSLNEDDRQSRAESMQIWKEYADGVKQFWNAQGTPGAKPKPTGAAPKPPSKDGSGDAAAKLQERIDKLNAEADAEGRLAQAISGSTSETIKATAAAEAEKTIETLNAEGKKHHIQLTDEQRASVEAATLRLLAYKEALNVNKEIEQAITKTQEQVIAQTALAAAYTQGAEAIVAAEEKAQLGKYIHDVDQLQAAYNDMAKSGQFTATQLAQLGSALDQARQKLTQETAAVHAETVAKEAANAAKWDHQLGIENGLLQQQIIATLGGADALKKYAIAKQLAAFKEANPFASPEDMVKLKSELEAQMSLDNQLAAAQKVHALERYKDLKTEIATLQELRKTIIASGGDTRAVDAAIQDDQKAQEQGYIDLLDKSQSYGDGAIAALRRLRNETQTDAQQMDDLLTHAADGFENTLNDAIVKGKANWADLANSIEMDLLKLAEKNLMSKILGGLGNDGSGNSGGGLIGLIGGLFSHKAGGGPINEGQYYMVGEHGPEMIVPRTAGTVIPNANLGGGGKTTTVNQVVNIKTDDADSFKRSKNQIQSMLYSSSARAHGRNM